MTHANTEQSKFVPWFAKAGAACSIVPLARFVGPNIFALKGGGYGCLFALTGIDEEGLTDQELDSRMRSIEGALRGLPEGSCLYQYTRVMSGFDLPRQARYASPATEVFANDRLTFLEETAGFRRIDLHWCLTLEPSKATAFERKPQENAADTSRMLAELEKTATILQSHLGSTLGLRLHGKSETFQFFSYLFNLEEWAGEDRLRSDAGVDRQIVKSPVAWHSDYLQVGKRHVQMFSLKATPEASRPCLFSGLLTLDCDSVLCSTWRAKTASAARSEIDAQEKFISFFKVGVLTRVMSGRDTASLETGAGAKAANNSVDDLSDVIRSLDKKAQGEYSLRLLLAAQSTEQLRNTLPAVHRIFVAARAQVMEETLGNLSAFYAMFPGNHKFNVFPLWLAEDHHARLSSVFAPHIGHPHSEDLDNEYLNIFETRIDFDGEARIAALRASDAVPAPSAILSTSPGKYQVLWCVDGFDFEQQEATLKLLAIAFGGDPACTDCNRVLRIPGFWNCKYSPAHAVAVEYPCDSTWNPADFQLENVTANAVLPLRGIARQMRPEKQSHSEQDWAWVLDELSHGMDAGKLTRALAERRADKPNPLYYAQRTVDVASARLWLLEGAPIDDVITMLKVRRAYELPTALCSARAREIATTAQRIIARKKIA